MRVFLIILFLVIASPNGFGQTPDSILFHRGSFIFGIGLGTKSHIGNAGLIGNIFVTRNLSFKGSIGAGSANFNGGLLSIGPEICWQRKKKIFYIGSSYTTAGGSNDVVDEDKPSERRYTTYACQYIRSCIGIGFCKPDLSLIYKIEIGYSYLLHSSPYKLGGPSVWTADQKNVIDKGLGSGLLVTFIGQFSLQKGHKNKIKG